VRLEDVGELGLIRRLRSGLAARAAGVLTGVGDDTAVLAPTPGAALLATTDLVIENVHFRRGTAPPRDVGWKDVGWKALAVNLSDIAAMGGRPRWALIGLALPDDTDLADVDALYAGLREAAAPHGVAIVGGDTCASRSGLVLDVTLLGEHAGTPRLRSMARPGHVVAVTGSLGRSAAGLHALETRAGGAAGNGLPADDEAELVAAHRRPTARVAEGHWLAAQPAVHAMIDCSDGLATDLGHVCAESRVGARVAIERLPISAATRRAAAAFGRDPLAWALSGGEDYELLVTVEAAAAADVARGLEAATGTPLTVVGEITAEPGGPVFVDAGGAAVSARAGYEHFRAGGAAGG
jgi:thiamine-monophosphate kinase